MNLLRRLPAGIALLLACAAAVGDGASGDSAGADLQACLMCHEPDEFESHPASSAVCRVDRG
jgi:hypothetical protein